MKKIITLFAAVFVFISMQIMSAAEENTVDNSKLDFLHSLGIADDDISEIITENEHITRAQAAVIASRILYSDEISEYADTVYEDVDKDSYGSGAISFCSDMGIMKGVSDTRFAPDDYITNADMLKTLLCAVGYEAAAEKQGGYNGGYASIALSLGVKLAGSSSDLLTSRELVSAICDLLEAPILEISYSETSCTYSINNDKTVLSEYFDIYKSKGVVTDNGYTALTGKSAVSENEAVITLADLSSYEYLKGSAGIDGMLGKKIEYYFKDNGWNERVIYYAEELENKELTINKADIEAFSSSAYRYTDKSGRSKNAKVKKTADIVYNDSAYLPKNAEEMIPKDGYVRLIDNDNDGIYDVVFIYSFTTMMIKSTYKGDDMYSILGMGDESVRFDVSGIVMRVYIDGQRADFSDISKYQVASVAVSHDEAPDTVVSVYVSDTYIDGRIDSISSDEWIIDGKSYDLAQCLSDNKYYYDDTVDLIKFDSVMTVRLDIMGQIAGVEEDILNPDSYVFLISAVYQESDESLTLRVYTSKGKFKTLNVVEKPSINGVRRTSAKAAAERLRDGSSKFSPQVAMIKQNDSGVVTGINIAGEQLGETEALTEDVKDTTVTYKQTNKIFSGLFAINESSVVFMVNPDDYSDMSNYSVCTPDDINSTSYTACAYDVKDNGTAKAVVLKTGVTEMTIENDVFMAVLSHTAVELDEDDEPRTRYYFYQKGVLNSAYIDKKYEEQMSADKVLTKGDAFRYYLDPMTKEITTIMRHCDYENRDNMITESSAATALQTDYNYLLRFVYGTVIERSGSIIKVRIKRDSEPLGYIDRIFSMARSNIMIYDESRTTNNVSQGKVTDIRDYASIGDMDSASRVFMRQRYGEVLDTIVYQP